MDPYRKKYRYTHALYMEDLAANVTPQIDFFFPPTDDSLALVGIHMTVFDDSTGAAQARASGFFTANDFTTPIGPGVRNPVLVVGAAFSDQVWVGFDLQKMWVGYIPILPQIRYAVSAFLSLPATATFYSMLVSLTVESTKEGVFVH